MKKILAFCLLISLLIGLVGCGKKAHIVFPFAASDVTKEINYLSFATKSGRLQSENAGFDYFTSGDLVGLWENLSGESEVVSP